MSCLLKCWTWSTCICVGPVYAQFDNCDIWMARQMTMQTTLPFVMLRIWHSLRISIWWPRAMEKHPFHLKTLGNFLRLIMQGPYWKELLGLHQGSKQVRHAGSQQGVMKPTKLGFVESVPIARTFPVLLEERISFVPFVGKYHSPSFWFFQVSCTDMYSQQHSLCYAWSCWCDCLCGSLRHAIEGIRWRWGCFPLEVTVVQFMDDHLLSTVKTLFM